VFLVHFISLVVLVNALYDVKRKEEIIFGHHYESGMFICANILQIVYIMSAFANRNVLQLRFVMANFVFSFLAVFLPSFVSAIIRKATGELPYVIAIGVELTVVSLVVLYLLRKVEGEIGWELYKILGAGKEIQQMWRNYQIFMVHIKAICVYIPTVFECLSVTGDAFDDDIQNRFIDVTMSTVAFIGMIICMPLAYIACKGEKRWLINIVLVFYILHAAMCILEVVVADTWSTGVYFAILFLWTLILLYYGFKARLNFGKGLTSYYDRMGGKDALKTVRNVDLEDDPRFEQKA